MVTKEKGCTAVDGSSTLELGTVVCSTSSSKRRAERRDIGVQEFENSVRGRILEVAGITVEIVLLQEGAEIRCGVNQLGLDKNCSLVVDIASDEGNIGAVRVDLVRIEQG